MDSKLKKEIDRWEEKSHVFVSFTQGSVRVEEYVALEGEFYAHELSEIASILRKVRKQTISKPEPVKQPTLFDQRESK